MQYDVLISTRTGRPSSSCVDRLISTAKGVAVRRRLCQPHSTQHKAPATRERPLPSSCCRTCRQSVQNTPQRGLPLCLLGQGCITILAGNLNVVSCAVLDGYPPKQLVPPRPQAPSPTPFPEECSHDLKAYRGVVSPSLQCSSPPVGYRPIKGRREKGGPHRKGPPLAFHSADLPAV
jgi:hypothetical protein